MLLRRLIVAVALIAPAAGEDGAPPPLAATQPVHLLDVVRLSAASIPVELAKLQVAVARAELGGARSALRPNLAAEGRGSRGRTYLGFTGETRAMPTDDLYDARLRLGQALIDLGAWNRACAASRRLAAADAATAVSLQDAAAGAAQGWLSLARAQALIEVRRRDAALADDLLRLARAQVEIGVAEPIAVTRADKRVAETRAAIANTEGDLGRSAIALARALNLAPASVFVATGDLGEDIAASDAPQAIDDALAAAQDRRPELALSAEQLAAAEADRRAARGDRLPRLAGFADYGRIGPELDDTVTTWQVGLQLTVPLINRSMSDEQAARARAAQERLRRIDTMQRIEAEVRDAVVALSASRAQLVAIVAARGLAEQELQQARARFAAGAVSNLELIDAQRGLTGADEALIGARLAVAQARVRLARAVGVATTLR